MEGCTLRWNTAKDKNAEVGTWKERTLASHCQDDSNINFSLNPLYYTDGPFCIALCIDRAGSVVQVGIPSAGLTGARIISPSKTSPSLSSCGLASTVEPAHYISICTICTCPSPSSAVWAVLYPHLALGLSEQGHASTSHVSSGHPRLSISSFFRRNTEQCPVRTSRPWTCLLLSYLVWQGSFVHFHCFTNL